MEESPYKIYEYKYFIGYDKIIEAEQFEAIDPDFGKIKLGGFKRLHCTRKSPFSGKTKTIVFDVSKKQYENWINGMVIQKAMPHLDADSREFIMTGITGEEWDENFKDD